MLEFNFIKLCYYNTSFDKINSNTLYMKSVEW